MPDPRAMADISGIRTGFMGPSASTPAGRTAAPASAAASGQELTTDQQSQVRELQKTDAKVRTHEQAHKTAGGPYAGGIRYEYTTGPDGRRYVTGGEVPIDVSPVRNNPEATITKMEVVKRAALAPQEPSPQDRAVAAQADANKAAAQTELRQQQNDPEGEGTGAGEAAGVAGEAAGTVDRSTAPSAAAASDADLALRLRQAGKSYGRADATARPAFSIIA
ncbi:putative metalloprotease CJM1_0395 family protein [Niveispirillum fermenti]|uniref:putative metalloprotease CJM1_0395 family protein n=1 Tax=Niveispirillum fermenti TaxID=1233113 RepID=UPI0040436C67